MVDLVLVQFVEERVLRGHGNNARYLEIGHARYRRSVVVCSGREGVVKRGAQQHRRLHGTPEARRAESCR